MMVKINIISQNYLSFDLNYPAGILVPRQQSKHQDNV